MKSFIMSKRVWLLSISYLLFIQQVYGQSSPVSQSANSMVNILTGDFHYSVPVMTVPGPNGENVSISFNYDGGITNEQQASWIGLGWNYNPGEIVRSTGGAIADDWKNKAVTTKKRTSTNLTEEVTNYYGPIYYKDINTDNFLPNYWNDQVRNSMDLVTSTANLRNAYSVFPGYDSYHVSGPGISGKMEIRLFNSAACLFAKRQTAVSPHWYDNAGSKFTRTPNFIFLDDITGNVGTTPWMYYDPNVLKDNVYAGGSSYGDINYPENRLKTANYIEYFTNSVINSNPAGFLDYRIISSGDRRPATEFDQDGIGAFRITTPSGMVYHYSLPVYNSNELIKTFTLNSNFDIDNNQEYTEMSKEGKYAVSWKLTTITGSDYVDSNNNGIADIGDTGYWIAYKYGKWTDSFTWRFPFFNFKQGQFNKQIPSRILPPSAFEEIYKEVGTVNTGISQGYYLNSIQTSTHTAFFIKNVRLDNHSTNESGKLPSLRLDKIVLINNEDIGLFDNSGTLACDSRFSITNCYPTNIKPHLGSYITNEALIKSKSLETVELSYDYGLCKMLYNNINNTFDTPSATYHYVPTDFDYALFFKFDEQSGISSTTDNKNSGKLTLNEIKVYGLGHRSISPSYLFDYDKSNSIKNPSYSTFKTDWWGYFKSDFNYNYRGHHTTIDSKLNTDAWSMKKITTPLGGEISIEYESNIYRKVYDGFQYIYPKRYFLIKSATPITELNWLITTNKESETFSGQDSLISKKVYLPYGTTSYTCGLLYGLTGRDPSINQFCPNLILTPTTSSQATQTYNISNICGNGPTCDSPTLIYDPNNTVSFNGQKQGWGFLTFEYSSIQGGGSRVKSITLKDVESNLSYINEYEYELGSCGTETGDFWVRDEGNGNNVKTNDIANDPLAPGSGVTYGKVTVKSKSLNNTYNGKTVYEYNNNFNAVVGHSVVQTTETFVSSTKEDIHANIEQIKTNGIFCSPSSTTIFDNNDNIIYKTIYEYSDPITIVPSIRESFFLEKVLPQQGYAYRDLYFTTRFFKTEKNARLIRKTTYVDCIKTVEEPLVWDALTGAVTKSRTIDPTNGVTISTITPAYTQTEYLSMGAKSIDPTFKNLLIPSFKKIIEKDKITLNPLNNEIQPEGSPELISATKMTWQQSFPQRVFDSGSGRFITQTTSSTNWKPYQNFIYNGGVVSNTNWREEGEVTIFNKRNNILEIKAGESNRYSGTKYGYDQKFMIAQANDCKYSDFTFSGFEDQETVPSGTFFGGEISGGQMRYAGDANVKPHTGNYVAKVDAGNFGPGYFAKNFTTGRSYRASVWVHSNSPAEATLVFQLDGSRAFAGQIVDIYKTINKSDASNTIVGDWTLMTTTIDVPSDFYETNGNNGFNDLRAYLYNPGSTTAYFDDFIVRPLDADISGNVIDERTGRTIATIDKYGFGVRYVYDDGGRVKAIWSETVTDGWKLKTRYSFNFKRTY